MTWKKVPKNEEDTVELLFPVPFYKSNIEIKKSELDFIKKQKFTRNYNAFIVEKNVLACEEMKDMVGIITEKVKTFFYEICGMSDIVEPELVNSWVNLHQKGDWAQTHNHYNSIITGVLYLDVNENSGDFNVYRESHFFGPQLYFEKREENRMNAEKVSFRPKNGDLYLFPAHIKHDVSSNNSDLKRLSLAFNYMMRGIIKSEYSEVKI